MFRELHATRRIMLLFADLICMLVGSFLGMYLEFADRTYAIFEMHYYAIPLMLLLFYMLFNVNNLFTLSRKVFSEVLLGILVNMVLINITLMAVSFLGREFVYSRKALLYTAVIQTMLVCAVNYVFWRWERYLAKPRTMLLVSDKEECLHIIAKLGKNKFSNSKICSPVELSTLANSNTFDTIIVGSKLTLAQKKEAVFTAHMHNKRVIVLPSVYEVFTQGMVLDYIDDVPVFKSTSLKPLAEQRLLKRCLDIVGSLIGLIIFSPIMLVVAIAICCETQGDPIYTQLRVGRDEKEFTIYKFRSMYINAEKHTGAVLATENDPRITNVGNIIRMLRLDELPQLINVLMGDMSLVGPRPERMFFVNKFKQRFAEYTYRHAVKPGITGMAQVYGKYNTTAYDKLIYDLMYIQKCSVSADITIIIQTIKVLFMKKSTEGVKS